MSSDVGRPQPRAAEDTIARNAALAFAVQVITSVFTAALTLFLVRALSPEGFGLFALALSIGALVLVPSDFGISQSAARFIAERRGDRGAVAEILGDALKLKLVASGFVSAALFVAAGPIADLYGKPGLTWPLRGVAIAVFAQSVMLLFGTGFVAMARVATNLRIVAAESTVELGASVALVLLGSGAAGAAFGRAIGYGFGALFALAVVLRRLGPAVVSPRFRAGRGRRIAGYAGALAIVDGAFTIYAQMDVLLVGAFLGSASVGLFSAPLRLTALLQYPGLAIASGVAPRLSRTERRGPGVDAFARSIRYLVILQAAFLPPVIVWAGPIVELLLGADYEQSANVLRALAPYVFLTGLAPLVSLAVNYLGDARRRVPIALGTLVVSFVLDLILIPRYGIVGAAIAGNVGYLLYTPAHLWVCRRFIDLPLRPILVTLARALAAAAAASGILLAAGTDDLTLGELLLGGAGALVVYVSALVAMRELSPREVSAAAAVFGRGPLAGGGAA